MRGELHITPLVIKYFLQCHTQTGSAVQNFT